MIPAVNTRRPKSDALLSTLRITPLLVFPLALFVLGVMSAQGEGWTNAILFTLSMISGAQWGVSYGDLFVFGSLLILFVEVVKSVHTDARAILNHGLSMLVAVVCIVLFVTSPGFTNSAFFLLIAMTLIDVIAGFVITIVAARRDFGTQ